jgi:hypothetical protein
MDPDLVFRARLRDKWAHAILVAAAVIVAAVVAMGLLPESDGERQEGLAVAASPLPVPSPVSSPSPWPPVTPSPTIELAGVEPRHLDIEAPGSGVGPTVRVQLMLPAGWASADAGRALYKPAGQPSEQDANSPMLAIQAVAGVVTDVCRTGPRVTFTPIGPTVEDMATALATLIGPERRGPTDVVLGGYPARRFDLTHLLDECGGPEGRWLWETATGAHFVFLQGATATIYVVDVDGDRLVIATHYRGSPVDEVHQLDAIIASIDIEPRAGP